MKVTGLDPTPSKNKITVEIHPCIIAGNLNLDWILLEKGISGLFLNCETTDIGNTNDIWYQGVRVWVKDKVVSRCIARTCSVGFSNISRFIL